MDPIQVELLPVLVIYRFEKLFIKRGGGING